MYQQYIRLYECWPASRTSSNHGFLPGRKAEEGGPRPHPGQSGIRRTAAHRPPDLDPAPAPRRGRDDRDPPAQGSPRRRHRYQSWKTDEDFDTYIERLPTCLAPVGAAALTCPSNRTDHPTQAKHLTALTEKTLLHGQARRPLLSYETASASNPPWGVETSDHRFARPGRSQRRGNATFVRLNSTPSTWGRERTAVQRAQPVPRAPRPYTSRQGKAGNARSKHAGCYVVLLILTRGRGTRSPTPAPTAGDRPTSRHPGELPDSRSVPAVNLLARAGAPGPVAYTTSGWGRYTTLVIKNIVRGLSALSLALVPPPLGPPPRRLPPHPK